MRVGSILLLNTASAPPAATPTPASRGAGSVSRPTPKAGATVRNGEGMELVYVPAGSFLMGSTEAEWEYAARGGTTTSFAFGDKLTAAQANCGDTYPATAAKLPGKTVPVGSFPANGFGLYDMHGNVAEWVEDAHHDSNAGAPADGSAWVDGRTAVFRVVRGGSWERDPDLCRSARRRRRQPALAFDIIGLRVVATPK